MRAAILAGCANPGPVVVSDVPSHDLAGDDMVAWWLQSLEPHEHVIQVCRKVCLGLLIEQPLPLTLLVCLDLDADAPRRVSICRQDVDAASVL